MAMAQTREAARLLAAAHADLAPEVVGFSPRGDLDQISKLDRHGGKGGAFVAEIRDAMRRGELEAAMHSLKDMPGDEETPGLVIAAYLAREPVEDVLVARAGADVAAWLEEGLAGRKIGTNSVRRAALLRRLYLDADIIHYRGAVDTRIRKLDEGAMQKLPGGGEAGPADAIVVARAGLVRLGLDDRISKIFTATEMLPAAGQGIVALECAVNDWLTRSRLAGVDNAAARAAALAEREVLWVLNGHCNTPIAAHARLDGDQRLSIRAAVMSEDGATMIEASAEGATDRPREIGRKAGLELLAKGAATLVEASRP